MKNEDKIIFAILALAAVINFIPKTRSTALPEDIEKKKIEINLSIDAAEKKVLENLLPDEKKDCECGGNKYIIHGDGHRTPCPCGENCKCTKLTTMYSDEQKNGIINFYTLPGCAPCQRWKNEIKPWVEASGWSVVEVESQTIAPWFEIWINNKQYTYTGFMSKESFKEIVKNAK